MAEPTTLQRNKWRLEGALSPSTRIKDATT